MFLLRVFQNTSLAGLPAQHPTCSFLVVVSAGDKTIKLWSISDGACLRTFEGHGASVLRACFATVGTQVSAEASKKSASLV